MSLLKAGLAFISLFALLISGALMLGATDYGRAAADQGYGVPFQTIDNNVTLASSSPSNIRD